MTYKRQMEKVIKEYLASVGFKYYAPRCTYVKRINDDVLYTIIYGTASYYMKEFYELSIDIRILYRSWNNLLYQLTEGSCDFDSFLGGTVFFPARKTWNEEQIVFTGERSIKENIDIFQKELETCAYPILERYTDKEVLYQDMLNQVNEFAYCKNKKQYMPIAHYVNGNYEAALQYVEEVLKVSTQNYQKNPQAPAYIKDLHDFTLYQKNLKKLIAGQSLPPRDTPSIVTQILQKLYKK